MLDHGGNLRHARKRYGDGDWIDLSTGINPIGYPAPPIAPDAWQRLPEPDPELLRAACEHYGAPQLLAVAGTQAAIQALPQLRPHSRVTVAAPTYAEHAAGWSRHGHLVGHADFSQLGAAAAACDVLVVCNPNNPTGAMVEPERLLALHARLAARGGWLVVDEAFGDLAPELSVAAHTGQRGLVVLRSIGKFFGLAGLRLGFVAAHAALLEALADRLGPWMVSGPAQQVALAALRDGAWQHDAKARLARDGARMRTLLARHGFQASGTPLFHWWREEQADAFHEHMARRAIWTRLFRDGTSAIRVGLPAHEAHWIRIEQALHDWTER